MRDRLVYAEVDLKAFADNFSQVKEIVGPRVKVMAVVKGNAYGHGITQIALQAEKLGADYLGVACLYEARKIRQAGVKLPILILGYTDCDSLEEVLNLAVTPTIIDLTVAEYLNELSRLRNIVTPVHINVDSGMHRFGLLPDEALKLLEQLQRLQNIKVEGVFTHFAESDAADLTFTKEQLAAFTLFLQKLETLRLTPPLVHAANSAAVLRLPESHFSMVRVGKILYGPISLMRTKTPFIPQQIVSLKTKVVQLKNIEKGQSVGYGRAFFAPGDMTIAVIPVGYADGFRRAPQTYGEVLVKGERCPLVGRVSMDQATIDVTHVSDVVVGDEVVIIGKQKNQEISVINVADRLGTISYEVLTSFTERVGREYL